MLPNQPGQPDEWEIQIMFQTYRGIETKKNTPHPCNMPACYNYGCRGLFFPD